MNFTQALTQFLVALKGRETPKIVEYPTPMADDMKKALDRLKNPPKPIYLEPQEEYSMDPVTITLIINGLVTLIKACRDQDPEVNDDQLVASARGAAGVRAIRKSARKAGLRGRRFRDAVRESVDEVRAMSDDEIKEEFLNAPEFEKDEDGNDGIDYDLFK
jgi:hypothetical protein